MPARWLRHPSRTIRPPVCPHGRPFASRWLALAAIPSGCTTDLTPTAPEENP